MISVCLADSLYPATSLNLKQIMRKSFKIATEVFHNPQLMCVLYDEVAATLGATYPELVHKEREAKLIIKHEEESYSKMRANFSKKWIDLIKKYPEVAVLDVMEMNGFPLGYKEFKETMMKKKSSTIPGELVFKLYDTHGFQDELIYRIAKLNNLDIDHQGFQDLLSQHKSRHKVSLKEQSSNRGQLFNKAIERIVEKGVYRTNDQHKYDYSYIDNKLTFKNLKTKLLAILNEDCEWIDFLDPCQDREYYLVTKDTNFYCEEGGQIADSGVVHLKRGVVLKVNSVFKIRDFVFHKGNFVIESGVHKYVNNGMEVALEIDSEKRVKVMKNHTSVHLLNEALRRVLQNSAVCQIGSNVTDTGLSLSLGIYGEKLSKEVIFQVQDLIRMAIQSDTPVQTRVIDSMQLSKEESVLTVPGETYPESGLRLVTIESPLISKELCCGSHVPKTRLIEELCVTTVKGAGSNAPTIYAITGDSAIEARKVFYRAYKLHQIKDLVEPGQRQSEADTMRAQLAALCPRGGAPAGEYARCLQLLDGLCKHAPNEHDEALRTMVQSEVSLAVSEALSLSRPAVVHFVRSSYLLSAADVRACLCGAHAPLPTLLVGCAGGVMSAVCTVPELMVSNSFTAERWLSCLLPVFDSKLLPPGDRSPLTFAEMATVQASLITCEQQVQDAMRLAIQFAKTHLNVNPDQDTNAEKEGVQQS